MDGIFTKRIWQPYHHLVRLMLLQSEMNVPRVDEPVMIRAMFIYPSSIANHNLFNRRTQVLKRFVKQVFFEVNFSSLRINFVSFCISKSMS